MKILIPSLMALCASWCVPAFAVQASKGSKVVVPPLISKVNGAKGEPMIIRLPTQAGKVSKIVTTNLVTKGPSWIAKGDKYYSLCVPNRRMVSCAPIVAASVMKGIEVGAVAGAKGEPLITFKMNSVGLTPKRAAYAINYFLARTKKQVAHFNRMSVLYAPAPGQNALQVGQTSNYAAESGGGSCGYDDGGSYDCGGDSGGSGGDPFPNEPTGQCSGNCDYPTGNDNGNSDPCIAPDGSRICNSPNDIPSVPISGERPSAEEPMGCRIIGPFTVECGAAPPVIGGIPAPEELPRVVPWLSQDWCNFSRIFCSAGQEPEPDNDRGADSAASGKSMSELYEICEQIETVERDVCRANRGNMDTRSLNVCFDKAAARKLACYATARRLTNNGQNPSP